MSDRVTAKEFSINNGDEIKVGGSTYFGRNPVYQEFNIDGIKQLIKVKKGIPWVKVA